MKILLSIVLIFSSSSIAFAANDSCRNLAGTYNEGGYIEARYTVNPDCSGTYCVKMIEREHLPKKVYGWHCDIGRGVQKITHWKKDGEKYYITFKSGQIVKRDIIDLVKD